MNLLFYLIFTALTGTFVISKTSESVIQYKELLFGVLGRSDGILSEDVTKEVLKIYAPISDEVTNTLCSNHSLFYLQQILSNAPWALRMLDSSSKVPAGILMGNLVDLGNYDECVQIEDIAADSGKFSGQHCLVLLGRHGEDVKKKESARLAYFADDVEIKKALTTASHQQWSMCVPSSCRPSDVRTHLQSVFRNLSVRVDDVTCSSRATETSYTTIHWAAISFVSMILSLLFLSTTYDVIQRNSGSCNKLYVTFSLYTNGKELLGRSDIAGGFPCLDGIRVLCVFWIFLLHLSLGITIVPAINTAFIIQNVDIWSYIFIKNGDLAVDSFLLISGLLVCYNFLKKMDVEGLFNIKRHYLHRIVRVTPAYAALIFLLAALPESGNGPYWDYITKRESYTCQTYWWQNILYVHNYVNDELNMCAPHGWYLSMDMQLYIISPVLLLTLHRSPKIGKMLLGLLFSAGLLVNFITPYVYEIDVATTSKDYFRKIYFPTHSRFVPWLLGIGLGYLLHTTKKKTLHMPTALVAVGWLLSAVLMLTSLLFAHRFLQPDHQYERLLESLYICLKRPAWAVGLAWIIFASSHGYGGFVNSYLSSSIFGVVSRLSYSIYLSHMFVLGNFLVTVKTPQHLSDAQFMGNYLRTVALSIALAIGWSLAFEKPFVALEKYIMKEKKEFKDTKQN